MLTNYSNCYQNREQNFGKVYERAEKRKNKEYVKSTTKKAFNKQNKPNEHSSKDSKHPKEYGITQKRLLM